ncbi:MAG TPA: hypothetical protein H9692_06085 [Firmicutes bacterium]|nr:hypothetical protein [Bacillota bacterium]
MTQEKYNLSAQQITASGKNAISHAAHCRKRQSGSLRTGSSLAAPVLSMRRIRFTFRRAKTKRKNESGSFCSDPLFMLSYGFPEFRNIRRFSGTMEYPAFFGN